MAAVFDYLLETLPIVGAVQSLNARFRTKSMPAREIFNRSNAEDLRSVMHSLRPGDGGPAPPTVPTCIAQTVAGKNPPIWGVDLAAEPHRVIDGVVRVRELGWRKQLVFSSVEWGFDRGLAAGLDRFVLVSDDAGRTLKLPLRREFLYADLLVHAPVDVPQGHDAYRPGAPLDWGLVRSFLFDITSDGRVLPFDPVRATPREVADWKRTQDAISSLHHTHHTEFGVGGSVGNDLFAHQVMVRSSSGALGGRIGGNEVGVRPLVDRCLVTIALGVTRATAGPDQQRLSIVSRVTPHLHVASSLRLTATQASCAIVRPSASTPVPEASGGGAGIDVQDIDNVIQPFLFAEANAEDQFPPTATADIPLSLVDLPHWALMDPLVLAA